MRNLDWKATEERARTMSAAALSYARADCRAAALAADTLEAAGCRVDKTGGYYLDESSVYIAEQRRRLES